MSKFDALKADIEQADQYLSDLIGEGDLVEQLKKKDAAYKLECDIINRLIGALSRHGTDWDACAGYLASSPETVKKAVGRYIKLSFSQK